MGLTKPRAAQIFNLDYKQSTRVVTTTNITLTGGAPNSVDGINLSLNDRVLVTGQSTASQNGLYLVTTLGSGSNGTWARTSDGNENGEIEAGMIVMVTEGTIYADTQWKLITDDPIVIGTTALTFTQNYMANSISAGTSNVVVNSNANVTVSSAGTANVLTVSNTGAFVSGVASASGNITGGNLITAGLVSATGAVTGAAITGTSLTVSTGNITAGNLLLSGAIIDSAQLDIQTSASNSNIALAPNGTGIVTVSTQVSAVGNVTGGNILTAGLISATGTITSAANITGGNILTGGLVSATGNVTGNYILGNGSLLTGVSTSSSNINNGTSNVTVVSSGGDVTVGIAGTSNVAVFANTGLAVTGVISASGNITGGNILTAGLISATGAISTNSTLYVQTSITVGSGASSATVTTGAGTLANPAYTFGIDPDTGIYRVSINRLGISAGGTNAATFSNTAVNLNYDTTVTGTLSATGNVIGNYFIGNGSQLTGISASSNSISNGTSNVVIATTNGNINLYVAGQDTVEVSPGELTVYGVFSNPKTISSNVVIGPNINSMLIGPIAVDPANNIFVPTGSTLNII